MIKIRWVECKMRQLIVGLGLLAVLGLAGCSGGGSGGGGSSDTPVTEDKENQAPDNTSGETAMYVVSLNATLGGSFNITGQQEVGAGSVLSATVMPDTGYRINSVTGCGGNLTDNTFTTAAITENCTVEASFSINSYSVTPMSGENGSISPEAAQLVNYGSTTSFTVTPDTGYRIDSVTGCGGNLTDNTFTTAAITENCTVEASFQALIVSTAKINDTGISLCGNYDTENEGQWSSTLNCADSGATEIADGIDADGNIVPAGQDAHYGRDALAAAGSLSKIGGGNAGFDFTKLDASGNDLPESASNWTCVRDNVTGLIWEVKDPSNGTVGDSLHDADDRYNWYSTNSSTNGGSVGFADDDGAICYGYNSADSSTFCNTQAYTARVNSQGLCGATDWRLPKKEELRSIVDYGRYAPSIDTNYFPNTRSNGYWSGSPYADSSDSSWIVYFDNGYDRNLVRYNTFHVRLVRSAP
jgi:hypothetical protein